MYCRGSGDREDDVRVGTDSWELRLAKVEGAQPSSATPNQHSWQTAPANGFFSNLSSTTELTWISDYYLKPNNMIKLQYTSDKTTVDDSLTLSLAVPSI